MNAIRSIVSMKSCKIPARLKLVLSRFGSLILLFQRTPVVQFFFPEASIMGGAGMANSFSLAITTVVGLGAFDSVAGISPPTLTQVQPLSGSTTVPAAVGSALNFEILCAADSYPKSWECVPLRPGLTLTQTTPTSPSGTWNNFVKGTPTTAETYTVDITAYRSTGYTSDSVFETFTIDVDTAIITIHPASKTIKSGTTTLSVTGAVGKGTSLNYQWYQGTSPSTTTVATGTSNLATYTTPSLSGDASYWCKVTRNGTVTSKAYSVVANSNTAILTIDNTAPTVTINQKTAAPAQADPTGTSPINFTVQFSESVANFATGDVTITGASGGTKTGTVTGSGTTYNVAVTGMTTAGTVIPSLAAGVATDAAGNPSVASTSTDNTVTYDATAPTVTINQKTAAPTQADPTGASPINYTVLFSESVANFATGDVTITGTSGGTKTATVTGSGTTYNVAVTGMTTAGTVIPSLAAGVASDAVGNTSVASTSTDNTVTFNVDPYATWASGLPANQRGASQIPQNDGVTNLMKFACNLNPLAADISKLTVGGNETKGLPVQSIVGGKLRMEFLRRKAVTNPGITYFMEFSSDLNGASWSSENVSTKPADRSVSVDWERVTVDDTVGGSKRFGRLKVTQP